MLALKHTGGNIQVTHYDFPSDKKSASLASVSSVSCGVLSSRNDLLWHKKIQFSHKLLSQSWSHTLSLYSVELGF